MNERDSLICLLRAVINGEKICGEMDWEKVYTGLHRHGLCNFVWELVQRDNVCPKEVLARFQKAFFVAIAMDTVQEQEITLVQQALEKNHIPTVMLKGWLMKKVYPRSDMRSMADVDILMKIEQEVAVHQQLLSLGYKNKTYGGKKDNVYVKEPYTTLEMHKNLFRYENGWNQCFNSPDSPMYIWNRVVPIKGFHYIYQMDLELTYVYMIAHIAKHLKNDGGIGIRAFIDLYVFRRHYKEILDWEKINRDIAMLDLATFAERAAVLSDCWFLSGNGGIAYPDGSYECFANYILDGGTYGNTDYFVINNEAMCGEKKCSGFQYIWKRAFPGRGSMEKRFPKLKDKGYLLPYYWGKRLWRDGWCRMGAVKNEIKSVKGIDYSRAKAIQDMYQKWGL